MKQWVDRLYARMDALGERLGEKQLRIPVDLTAGIVFFLGQVFLALDIAAQGAGTNGFVHPLQGADAVQAGIFGMRDVGDLILLRRRDFLHREVEVVVLPEMHIQQAVLGLDFSLLEALAPAIRILSGQVVHELVPAGCRKILIRPHCGTAIKPPVPDLHRGNQTPNVLLNVIALIEVFHEIFGTVVGVGFDCFFNFLRIEQQFFAVVFVGRILIFILPGLVQFTSQRRVHLENAFTQSHHLRNVHRAASARCLVQARLACLICLARSA